MKSIAQRIVRASWTRTAWIRRPIARRIDERAARLVSTSVRPVLDEFALTRARVEEIVLECSASRQLQEAYSGELDLTLNSLLRELARLRGQVEELSHMLAAERGGVVEEPSSVALDSAYSPTCISM